MKYLGLKIDKKLNFNVQIDSVMTKLVSKINLLYRRNTRNRNEIRLPDVRTEMQENVYCINLF